MVMVMVVIVVVPVVVVVIMRGVIGVVIAVSWLAIGGPTGGTVVTVELWLGTICAVGVDFV